MELQGNRALVTSATRDIGKTIASELQGKRALVTGATRGIGKAIAWELAQRGAEVIGTATSVEGAQAISADLSALNGRGVVLEVNDHKAGQALIKTLAHEAGLHILVNNAGITRDTLALRMKEQDWEAVIATNLSAVFHLSQAAIKSMLKAGWGRIINVTSVVGESGNAGQANYAAAKAGVAGMSRALAREVGSRQITVNCVAPGFIDTDMTRGLSETQKTALLQQIPTGRLGVPADVAYAVAFLASPQADYMTGTTLHVNGGMYM